MPNNELVVNLTGTTFCGEIVLHLTPNLTETIARDIHERYRQTQRCNKTHSKDPSTLRWDRLPEHLKASNRNQAEHILENLYRIGCTVRKVEHQDIKLMTFTKDETEIMAEMEHKRWTADRLRLGWKLGKKRSVSKRTSPYLVPYLELPDDIKELDRQMIRRIPELLANVGLEISRQSCRHPSNDKSR
jgi:hypothetical protein